MCWVICFQTIQVIRIGYPNSTEIFLDKNAFMFSGERDFRVFPKMYINLLYIIDQTMESSIWQNKRDLPQTNILNL